MTRWTSVRLAKARTSKAQASTARTKAEAKGSKDSKDSKDNKDRTTQPVRLESPDPENPGGAGGAHDPMRDDAMDGEERMVPRVPNLPPEPSARQTAEHELTGHAVYRSWCRQCVAVKGRAPAHSSREEGELPEFGIGYGFLGRADLVCQMSEQFNRMYGSDRC